MKANEKEREGLKNLYYELKKKHWRNMNRKYKNKLNRPTNHVFHLIHRF